MPTTLDRARVKRHLDSFDLRALFIEELGWDYGGQDIEATVNGRVYPLQAIAQKRGLVVYLHRAESDAAFPDRPTRQKIDRAVTRQAHEHILIFCPRDRRAQHWQWVKREPGRPARVRQHIYFIDQSGEALIQKLEGLVFTFEEEAAVTIVDVAGRVRAAFDVEKVTKRFYERFKREQRAFLALIEGIDGSADRAWYASLMLNRMMFLYFIQKRGFLDNNPDYLRARLQTIRAQRGAGGSNSFYRFFLTRLFHEGLGKPEGDREPGLAARLGRVPYLNGGLFDVHELERRHPRIDIADEAFARVFAFFDAYQWHLDDRPLRADNEINPDALGYIFEKYINQKQMGAYYTKEDITGYISRNTILPFLFDRAKKECAIAFRRDGVWRLLRDDPDRYVYAAVRHGVTYDIHADRVLDPERALPAEIAAGLEDVARRAGWNEAAPAAYGLPTETWREHIARRRRYEEMRAKLRAGAVASVNDLITYNLDIEQFAQDAIAASEGPELPRAFWKALSEVSVLDPTCGSGAFLFAALNILEPLYTACLEAMAGFVDDLARSPRARARPQALRDFRATLAQVGQHASERYFILKTIIVDNLYGVDIMEEAVEICKLRLFLKLAAQLESGARLEPLPDIDFNVRAGNALVGFASLGEVKRAMQGDWLKERALPDIAERAELADLAFHQFRAMQTEFGMDASEFAGAKRELRRRLDDLRAELDRYLSSEYGVREGEEEVYASWRASHQPFHWFVEFYGIMRRGGFDVIIGNPPYVEYRSVKEYTVAGYETLRCGNLYAFVLERAYDTLCNGGRMGMIVQLSLSCTERMEPIQKKLSDQSGSIWFAHFDDRPARLFDGLQHIRATIVLSRKGSHRGKSAYSTSYCRWRSEARPQLFDILPFTDISGHAEVPRGSIPKIGHETGLRILERVKSYQSLRFALQAGRSRVYYHNAPQYWVRAMDFAPYFWNERDGEQISSHVKSLFFSTETDASATIAALNSSLFYWWFLLLSNCRDLGMREIENFPLGLDRMREATKVRLCELTNRLMANFRRHKTRKETRYKTTGMVIYDEFNQKPSKPIVDEIDRVLAVHYGFTDEELDFIINYDIKYRMGL